MKKLTKNILLIAGLLLTMNVYSKKPIEGTSKNFRNPSTSQDPVLAANCSPAQKIVYLDFNNVRALIETGGLMWQNRAEGNASYEVPKKPITSNEPRLFPLFSGGLWMAGQDINGQLKAAVSMFGGG